MAFLSPSGATTQVYRARTISGATPELISINDEGEPADGSCKDLAFLSDSSLTFKCEATNLVGGASGELRYLKLGDAPVALFSGT